MAARRPSEEDLEFGEFTSGGTTVYDAYGNKVWKKKRDPPTCRQRGGKTYRTRARKAGAALLLGGGLLVLYNVTIKGVLVDTSDMVVMGGLIGAGLGVLLPLLSLFLCRDHITAEERMEARLQKRQEKRKLRKALLHKEDMRNPLRQANVTWLGQHHTGKLTIPQHVYWWCRLRVVCGVRMRLRDHPAHFMPYVDIFARLGVYKRRHILAFVNAFLKMDEDRSGTVDVDEFMEWIKYDADAYSFAEAIFRSFDTDKSGAIEFPEWCIALLNFCLAEDEYYANQLYTTYARSIYGGRQVMKSRDTDDMIKEMFGERGLKAAKEGTHRSKNPKENLQLARQKLLREGMMYNVEVGVLRKPFVEVCLAHPILISRIKDLGFKIKLCVGGAELWDDSWAILPPSSQGELSRKGGLLAVRCLSFGKRWVEKAVS